MRFAPVKLSVFLATYNQLFSAPIGDSQPTHWTALIDYAIVRGGAIEFFFRDGRAIAINL
ncbi:hypothetical protein [Trueperella abortisuis]|uniref:Uncharacterized protein n=1 Tax=Trueperella abortisuis TaxID=445930 RepID=A0ABT9PJ85_9ACTO|nr:hypothetical protein [Trueperella abortisuis]MDP9832779.1 hypothetical protein [Trueperella abortisuis]